MYGTYIQDLISIGEQWKIMVSGRVEKYTNKVWYIDPADKQIRSRDTIDNLTFLPRLGVVYQPLKATAVYASYTQGFLPQTASNRSAGGPFPLKAAASTKQV